MNTIELNRVRRERLHRLIFNYSSISLYSRQHCLRKQDASGGSFDVIACAINSGLYELVQEGWMQCREYAAGYWLVKSQQISIAKGLVRNA